MWLIAEKLGVPLDTVAATVARAADASFNINYGIRGGAPYGGRACPRTPRGFLGFAADIGVDMPVLEAVVSMNDISASNVDRGLELAIGDAPAASVLDLRIGGSAARPNGKGSQLGSDEYVTEHSRLVKDRDCLDRSSQFQLAARHSDWNHRFLPLAGMAGPADPAAFYRPIVNDHREGLSVVVPVYDEDPIIFAYAIESWLANGVDDIVLVIDVTDKRSQEELASRYPVRVLITDVPGKRDALRKVGRPSPHRWWRLSTRTRSGRRTLLQRCACRLPIAGLAG
jgi:hypothetical protein